MVVNMLEEAKSQKPVPSDILSIMDAIPHRYPFLLVDRITAIEEGKCIWGYKNVSITEAYFQGHFPQLPIMPGVLILEALAQVGAILVSRTPEGQGKIGLFAGLDGVRFRRPVVPGDRLDLYSKLLKLRGTVGKAYGKATVNGELIADGELMFSIVDPNFMEAQK